MSDEPTTLTLPSGRRIEFDTPRDRSERMLVRNPEGTLELTIRFTTAGPVVELSAAALSLYSEGPLSFDCDTLRVHARSGISLSTDGDLDQRVAGDQRVQVEGSSELHAQHIELRAERGDLELRADNDTSIDGKRVLINS
ncbi:hypothetical protein ACNOYE_25090 [Nannocystaceae bacterium ST9]